MLSAATAHQIRVFMRVRAKEMQIRVGFQPLNQPMDERGPVRFSPTRMRACSLCLSSTCVLSARLDVYVRSAPSIPATWLDGLAGRLGLSARYHYNISIPRFLALPKLLFPLILQSEVGS